MPSGVTSTRSERPLPRCISIQLHFYGCDIVETNNSWTVKKKKEGGATTNEDGAVLGSSDGTRGRQKCKRDSLFHPPVSISACLDRRRERFWCPLIKMLISPPPPHRGISGSWRENLEARNLKTTRYQVLKLKSHKIYLRINKDEAGAGGETGWGFCCSIPAAR